jgi:UDP-GlcNAc:undecaprenyl-phosphate/decaprenyl-phosphate GlcNAc-1-phosphate transferase
LPDPIALLLIFVVATVLSWGGVRLTRRYAVQVFPSNAPTVKLEPAAGQRGGGLAMLAVILLMFMPLGLWISDPGPVVRFALTGAMMAMIGFFEDLRSMPRPLRITAQVVAALIFVPGVPITAIGLPRYELMLPYEIGVIAALIWVVGLSTIYTYMDNIDGLASGHAVLVGLLWAFIAYSTGNPLVTVLSLLIVGASLGFLFHNLSSARIFMGEVGSTFIGFSLAALPLLMQEHSPRLIVSGALFVALFVFDAALTFTIYIVRGKYTMYPDRSHLYQRILRLGDPPIRVTILYLLISVGFGIAGIIYWRDAAWVSLFVVLLTCVVLFAWIKRRERAEHTTKSE